ncbi:hypothetical protein HNQ78_002987 [Phycisphaera mikurensis]|nr:hypothetical protein [Phycisphaera mikurensis]MBB6443218.1 hypothetical protein [Phycisphaera mikurensis]
MISAAKPANSSGVIHSGRHLGFTHTTHRCERSPGTDSAPGGRFSRLWWFFITTSMPRRWHAASSQYVQWKESATRTSPGLKPSSSWRSNAVSPVALPLYGPTTRSSTHPVNTDVTTKQRRIGKPRPCFCAGFCGNTAWLAGVSAAVTVQPSMRWIDRPRAPSRIRFC